MSEGIGARVLRKEDLRFLTGRGEFVADLAAPDALHCAIVRSPHAHARIRSIDVGRAASAAGVVAALVGADMAADGVGPMRSLWVIRSHDGAPMAEPPRWALARERVRHVGEPVAIVLAENRGAALDAAELVDVGYEPLPAVTASMDALADGAPQLHADAPGNVCFRWQRGDPAAVERAFAQAAHTAHDLPAGMEPGLQENAFYDPSNFAFSNGVHLCEVEIDPDTGVTRVVGYWAVDDVGTVVNPMIVEGQLHGAVAQGAGQALSETCVYDARGQLVSASFLDYAVPRADELPGFVSENDESQPCTHNPLGAKGCGEAGTIAAPAAVVNAILDALAPLGVDEIEMPATPHRVWQAIMRARREQAAAG